MSLCQVSAEPADVLLEQRHEEVQDERRRHEPGGQSTTRPPAWMPEAAHAVGAESRYMLGQLAELLECELPEPLELDPLQPVAPVDPVVPSFVAEPA